MDVNLLASLVGILQKQSNSIRKLQIANIALYDMVRLNAERLGVSYEDFHRRFSESLEVAQKSAPSQPWNEGIGKEIEEMIEELTELEKLSKTRPN